MEIKQLLVPANRRNQGSGTNTRKFLTIHQTDNFSYGAGAKAHANLQYGGYKGASWHWTVDDKYAYQSYPETAVCWHAGDGAYGPGNRDSIAIEFCVNPDSDYKQAFANAARLAADILKRNNIPIDNMVQHNRWTGKNCPSQIRARGEWAAFQKLVQHHLEGGTKPTEGFLMALSDSEQKTLFARVQTIQDILTGYAPNAYVQKGYSLPLIGSRVRDVKDYISGGGPKGEDKTLLRAILETQEAILDRLDAIENMEVK